MQERPGTLADMRFVLANLSAASEAEIAMAGYSMEDVRVTIKPMIKDGNAYAMTSGRSTLAILMFNTGEHAGEKVIQTFFLSTEAFFQQDSARLGKKLMRTIQRRFQNLPVISMNYGGSNRTERWYKLMGYELETFEGNLRVFRLPPSA